MNAFGHFQWNAFEHWKEECLRVYPREMFFRFILAELFWGFPEFKGRAPAADPGFFRAWPDKLYTLNLLEKRQ